MAAVATPLTLVLLGDIMLGRYVNDGFTCDASQNTAAFGDVLPFLHGLDPARTIIAGNLECAVTDHTTRTPKAFNFKLSTRNADVLQQLRLKFVATANNHVLDYGQPGLAETHKVLDRLGVRHAGSGTQPTAAQPAVVHTPSGHSVAFLAYSDHYEDWAASSKVPGINFIDPTSFDPVLLQQQVSAARAADPDLVVVMIHWGPNWCWQPDKHLRRLGQAFLAAGADLVFGTSPHHVQGVEVIGSKAIIYSGGSFIDDYAGDDHYRNELSAVLVAHYAAAAAAAPVHASLAVAAAGRGGIAGAAAAAAAAAAPAGHAAEHPGSAADVGQSGVPSDQGGAGASSPHVYSTGLVLQELSARPIAITHTWRSEGGPFAADGGGNPPYFTQVNFAQGADWDWVSEKLQQLSGLVGNKHVQELPYKAGIRLFGN